MDLLIALAWAIGLTPAVLALALYPWLPKRCTIHWDTNGRPNRSAPKFVFVAVTLIVPAITWLAVSSPMSQAALALPNYMTINIATLGVLAVVLIGATVANLIQ